MIGAAINRVHVWCDGYGLWHGRGDRDRVRRAIRREIALRSPHGWRFTVRLEAVPGDVNHWRERG